MTNEQDKQHLQELAAYRFTVDNLRARVAELEAKLAAAPQAVQAVAWLAEYVDREGNSKWYVSTHKDLATENDMNAEPKPLYTHPTKQRLDAETYTMSVERAGYAFWVKIPALQFSNARLQEQLLGVEALKLVKGVDAALAAQAKQGGSSNG